MSRRTTIVALSVALLAGSCTSWQWGRGLDVSTPNSTPGAAGGAEIDIATGNSHSCAIRADRALRCVGRNAVGQLDNGTAIDSMTPVQVGTHAHWVSIDAGEAHTCGIRAGQSLWCWGWTDDLTIGDGTSNHALRPVAIAPERAWQSVSAGIAHTCAIDVDGTAWCWGLLGPFGDPDRVKDS